ncbi:dsRBD fold-containing protein [Intrasporangium sp. DVR]|uniref:dsRBD fold-containing protein n=1 Tax=Intrasporangium sp. DVR TaxID=3127867 RepID=UPI00313A5716
MRARVGDRIILAAEHIDEPTRDGEILEIRGTDGAPPYLVRWSNGHIGLIYPGPGAVLRIGATSAGGGPPPATVAAPPRPLMPAAPSKGAPPVVGPGHVREWNVRVSIFESGDETSANVVLIADSPGQISARGTAHRSSHDPGVPEIGDEVAVARALRHLADQLMETAEGDVSQLTGEEAHIRAV